MTHLGQMPLAFGVQAIHEARLRENRQRAWQQWVAASPFMSRETFVPFEQFYPENHTPHTFRPAEEVLAEAERIQKAIKARKQALRVAEDGIE